MSKRIDKIRGAVIDRPARLCHSEKRSDEESLGYKEILRFAQEDTVTYGLSNPITRGYL